MDCVKKLFLWLLANAILPILIPVLFLCFADLLVSNIFPFWDKTIKLFDEGFYIFSAATLVFSLVEEHSACEKCLRHHIIILLCVLLFCTGVMFCLKYYDNDYIQNHKIVFLSTWFATSLFAIIAKFEVISYKKKNKNKLQKEEEE